MNIDYKKIKSTPAEISNMTVFAVDMNTPFDSFSYSDWANINPFDMDRDDVNAIQDAQSKLNDDEYLIIEDF